MELTTLEVERRGAVLCVRLNRPERLNAIDGTMIEELSALWRRTAHDPDVLTVVLTGAGRAFCAGADVADLAGPRRPRGSGVDEELSFLPGQHLEIPVVVAVNGVCAGGGLHFVADADLVIAATSATFTDPHVSVGQVSGIEPVSLAFRVSPAWVARLALLGRHERWDAELASRLGLVTEIVDADRLLERAMELAGHVVANSPAAVSSTRGVLRSVERALLHELQEEGWAAVQAQWGHPDCGEGPRAFAERREPRWERRSTPRKSSSDAL